MYPATCLVACLFVGVVSQPAPMTVDPQFQPNTNANSAQGGGTFDALLQSMFNEGQSSQQKLNQAVPVDISNTPSEQELYTPIVDTGNTRLLDAPALYTPPVQGAPRPSNENLSSATSSSNTNQADAFENAYYDSINTINAEIARLRNIQQSLLNKKNQATAPEYNQQSSQNNFATSAYDAQQNQQSNSPGLNVGATPQYNNPLNSNINVLSPDFNSQTAANNDVIPSKTPTLASTIEATKSASNIDAIPIFNKQSASGKQNVKPQLVKESAATVDVSILQKAGPPYNTAIDTNSKTQPNTVQKHNNAASQPLTKPSEIKSLHYKSQPTQLSLTPTQETVPKSTPGASELPSLTKDVIPNTKIIQPVEPTNSPSRNKKNTLTDSTASTTPNFETGFKKVFGMLKQLKSLSAVDPKMKNIISGMLTASQGYLGIPLSEKAPISQIAKPIVGQKQSVNGDKGSIVYPSKSTIPKETVMNKPKQSTLIQQESPVQDKSVKPDQQGSAPSLTNSKPLIKKPSNVFHDMNNQNANPAALPTGFSSQSSTRTNPALSPNANSQPLIPDASAKSKQMSMGLNTRYEPQTVPINPPSYPNSNVPPPSLVQSANNQQIYFSSNLPQPMPNQLSNNQQLYPNSNMSPTTVNEPRNDQHFNVPPSTLNQPANNQQLYPNSNVPPQEFNQPANNQQPYPNSNVPPQEFNQPANNHQLYPESNMPPPSLNPPANNQQLYSDSNMSPKEFNQPANYPQQYPNSNVPPQNIPSGTNIYTDPSQNSGMPSTSANLFGSTNFDQMLQQMFEPTIPDVVAPPNPNGGPQQQGPNGANSRSNMYPNTPQSLGLNNLLSPMGNAGSFESMMAMMASQGMAQGNIQGNSANPMTPMMSAQLKLMKIQAANRMHKAIRQAIISTGETNNIFGKMLYETANKDRMGAYGPNGIKSPIRDMEYVKNMKTLERLTGQTGALNAPPTMSSMFLLSAINKNRRLHRGKFDPESMVETLLRQ